MQFKKSIIRILFISFSLTILFSCSNTEKKTPATTAKSIESFREELNDLGDAKAFEKFPLGTEVRLQTKIEDLKLWADAITIYVGSAENRNPTSILFSFEDNGGEEATKKALKVGNTVQFTSSISTISFNGGKLYMLNLDEAIINDFN